MFTPALDQKTEVPENTVAQIQEVQSKAKNVLEQLNLDMKWCGVLDLGISD